MTKSWAKAARERTVQELEQLEDSIKNLMNQIPEGTFSLLVETKLIELETKRNKMLKEQGEH